MSHRALCLNCNSTKQGQGINTVNGSVCVVVTWSYKGRVICDRMPPLQKTGQASHSIFYDLKLLKHAYFFTCTQN